MTGITVRCDGLAESSSAMKNPRPNGTIGQQLLQLLQRLGVLWRNFSCHFAGDRRSGFSNHPLPLILIQILVGNVILGHLVSADFLLVGPVGGLDARHHTAFERISFFDQLVHTF
jgi:hypothetical protein